MAEPAVQSEGPGRLRIGELSRRAGVSPELLRVWERRYQLLSPARSEGGFRLYSEEDGRRVARMLEHLAAGISAAEAARLAREEPVLDLAGTDESARLGDHAAALRHALDSFDDADAHAALDRAIADFTIDAVLRDLVVPYLGELGERWERGEASVAQEHFASSLLRGRLLGLGRGWGVGGGPRALLACVPGELHDLGLICFGLALRARGWRVTYLGIDTPLPGLGDAAWLLQPAIVVLNLVVVSVKPAGRRELVALAGSHRLAVAGAGANARLAASVGAELLEGDPVTAAEQVASAT